MVKRAQRGITLVEMLITMAIIGAIAMIAPKIITNVTKIFILSKAKLELQEQARSTMYIVSRELRQAQSSTIRISRHNSSQPHFSSISFNKTGSSVTKTYYQRGSHLMLQNGSHTITLTKNLGYLAFTFPRSDDMTIVSVSVTLQQQIYGGAFKALHMASERIRVMN